MYFPYASSSISSSCRFGLKNPIARTTFTVKTWHCHEFQTATECLGILQARPSVVSRCQNGSHFPVLLDRRCWVRFLMSLYREESSLAGWSCAGGDLDFCMGPAALVFGVLGRACLRCYGLVVPLSFCMNFGVLFGFNGPKVCHQKSGSLSSVELGLFDINYPEAGAKGFEAWVSLLGGFSLESSCYCEGMDQDYQQSKFTQEHPIGLKCSHSRRVHRFCAAVERLFKRKGEGLPS